MSNRLIFCFLFIATLSLSLPAASYSQDNAQQDTLFQVSTIDALLDGRYEGAVTLGDVKQHGDIGLGTFAALDGELVMDGGIIYNVRADGSIAEMPDTETTPFAAVTWLDADTEATLESVVSFDDLQQQILSRIDAPNHFYAIRITGTFTHVTTRSVPKQQQPYPKLIEVVKHQSIFTRDSVSGVLVGLYSPQLAKSLNVPGFHFHFLSDDKLFGGHVLKISGKSLAMTMDATPRFTVTLPQSAEFQGMTTAAEHDSALTIVEKGE